MWHHDKNVLSTFSSSDSKNVWANVDSVGWKRIEPASTDGATNVYAMLATARAHGRKVSVDVNAQDRIQTAYLK